MPYHVGGHKPHPKQKQSGARVQLRVWATLLGAIVVFAGWFHIGHGQDYVISRRGFPLHAQGVIIVGLIIIVLAWVPIDWVDRAVRRSLTGTKPKFPHSTSRK